VKLTSTRQVDWEASCSQPYDMLIAASGYESRATYVSTTLDLTRIARKVAVAFHDRPVLARASNDRYFAKNGFDIINSAGSDGKAFRETILSQLSRRPTEYFRILVDYTSMTRVWYGAVLSTLREIESKCSRVDVTFAYSISKYAEPHEPGPNAHMGPISGFSRLALPNRKTALVLGLGYERDRGLGLSEYVEAAETFAFIANPVSDSRFFEAVLANNSQLLHDLGSANTFFHSFGDLQATSAQLSSLVLSLCSRDYRVILAPLGPKPFALICLLLATRFPEIDVWRVSQGEGEDPYDREPAGHVLACTAQFVSAMLAPTYDHQIFARRDGYLVPSFRKH
jgi:hypothetical protein